MLAEALRSLTESTRPRPAVLTALVRSPLTDEVRSLLHEIVRNGTKQEAVIAIFKQAPSSRGVQADPRTRCRWLGWRDAATLHEWARLG